MAKKKNEIAPKPDGRGSMGKYNLPTVSIQKIEQDDEKRAFMAKSIENNLYFFNVGLSPVKSDEEMCDRLNYFFEQCAETQQLPTVEKMANCLGYHRQTLYDWEHGKNHGFSSATAEIIRKAKQTLAAIDADLAQEGKIQPVVYMFRAKNFYNMRDQQEVVLTPNTTQLSDADVATIASKYDELPEAD